MTSVLMLAPNGGRDNPTAADTTAIITTDKTN